MDLPKRPLRLGKGGRNRFASIDAGVLSALRVPDYGYLSRNVVPSVGRGVRIYNSGSVTLTFDPVDLLPRETVDLTEVQLFTSVDLPAPPWPPSGRRAPWSRAVPCPGPSRSRWTPMRRPSRS